ncbi:MAG: YdiU family protein [Congregibacter sp.]
MPLQFDNSYAGLGSPLSVPQQPDPVDSPELIRVNDSLAKELGFDPQWLASDAGVLALAGNELIPGSEPVATAYAGHQFGQFNPQLGDGRAVLLGELLTPAGRRYDLQLKGSGRTSWSRGGDGRSPIGPVLREYLVSEAMAALGVPTTRALAAVTSGERVVRESVEPGAILTRVASSHLRVGTVQYFAAREDRHSLGLIVEHILARHYPQALDEPNAALALLNSVIEAQAALIARWQLLGFIHGVMNTDNMLLCGETVDYGPCAFMEAFHAETVFSSIDQQGRYAYCNQPGIAQWNLTRLAESLLPLIDDDTDAAVALAQVAIQRFPGLFESAHNAGLADKLGLALLTGEDSALTENLFTALQADQADFTLAFRFLADETCPGTDGSGAGALFEPGEQLLEWMPLWKQRQAMEDASPADLQRRMFLANPAFIPRNHLIQRAIEQGTEGDFSLFHRLTERLGRPGDYDSADRDLALPAKPEERVLRTFCGT